MQIELRPRGLAEVKIYFEKAADPEIAVMLPRGSDSLEEQSFPAGFGKERICAEGDICGGRRGILLPVKGQMLVFWKRIVKNG